jgi:uncharacterized protein YjbI with pentapeptide repeats
MKNKLAVITLVLSVLALAVGGTALGLHLTPTVYHTPNAVVSMTPPSNALTKPEPNYSIGDYRRAKSGDKKLQGTNLQGADLSGVDLTGVDLSKANLSGAVLNNTVLTGAILTSADLSWSTLENANLTGAELTWANMDRCTFSKGTILTNVKIQRATLTNVDLSNLDLSKLDWGGVNFNNSILSKTKLNDCYLGYTSFYNTDLRGTIFDRSNLYQANLTATNAQNASFKEVSIFDQRVPNSKDTPSFELLPGFFIVPPLPKPITACGLNLTQADLSGTDWAGTRLAVAPVFSSTFFLISPKFQGSNWQGATGIQEASYPDSVTTLKQWMKNQGAINVP